MIARLFASALFAGLVAGAVAALLQLWLVTPLLLEGELYEAGERVHFADSPDAPAQSYAGLAGAPPWEMGRHAISAGFNLVTFTAFGLLLAAGFGLAERFGKLVDARRGLIWGIAGFAALQFAPGAGLPPELPGTVAAEVGMRQAWWIGTVVATGLGLGMIAFGRRPVAAGLGIAVILLPHLIGAPHLDTYFGAAPPELAALFATRSLAAGALSWALLGVAAGWFWSRRPV